MSDPTIKMLPGVSITKVMFLPDGIRHIEHCIECQGDTIKEAYDTAIKLKKQFGIKED